MSEKVKRKKKLDETKTKEISTVSLQENKELTVGINTLPVEMQPSQPEHYNIDPETWETIVGTQNESLATDILVRGHVSHVCERASEKYAKGSLTVDFMKEMQPKNVLESMLCSQILSLHCVGMDSMRKSETENFQKDSHLNNAVKLFRVQHETIESLMKLRRNGEQKVIVQHVNVSDGGQAVVNGQLTTGDK